MPARWAWIGVAAALAVPGSASAANVRVGVFTQAGFPTVVDVQPAATPGSGGHALTLDVRGGVARVTAGAGTTLVAGAGCTANGAVVDCAYGGAVEIGYVGTGVADRVTVTPATVASGTFQLLGGGDTLAGGGGKDTVFGAAGADAIGTGGGADVVYPGTGADTVDSGAGDGDLVILGYDDTSQPSASDGGDVVGDASGAGDALSYFGHTVGVGVTVADGVANDGPAGEGDDVRAGFERLQGSPLADTLVGSGAAETIQGSGGDDRVTGGAGADTLEGNGGRDDLFADDGEVDVAIGCDVPSDPPAGNAAGETARVDPADPSPVSCETVTFPPPPSTGGPGPGGSGAGGTGGAGAGAPVVPIAAVVPAPSGAVRVAKRQRGRTVRGSVVVGVGGSAVTATLRRRGTRPSIGRYRKRSAAAGTLRFRVRLSRQGRRALRARKRLSLVLRVVVTTSDGRSRTVNRNVRLRR